MRASTVRGPVAVIDQSTTSTRRRGLLGLICLALLTAVIAAAPGSASASSGILEFGMSPTTTQAGGHPNVTMFVHYLNRNNPPSETCFCDDVKTITFHFPTGFIGDPHSQAICSLAEFSLAACPISAQVGQVESLLFGNRIVLPLYNLETHPDQAGQIGFIFPLTPFPNFIDLRARTDSDYGLDSATFPIPHPIVFDTIRVNIWGVPAFPENDFYRFKTPLTVFGECGLFAICGDGTVTNFPSPAPPKPYLENPTTCGGSLESSVDLVYYNGKRYHAEEPWPATTGCTLLTFNPSISVTPTTDQADTASGVDVDLKVPQAQSPTQPSPSQIRTTRTTLPAGFSINSSAADGKVACAQSETGIGTLGPAHCPEASKIGTLTLDVAALPGPIDGALYLGEPLPGEKYRVVLAADGFATHVKFTGTVRTDPNTGQLTMEFADLPQSPMQEFNLHIFGSERGLLATPTKCGTYPVESEFVPWDGVLPTQASTSYFTIDRGPDGGPCPGASRPFTPDFGAGSNNPTAAMYSPFNMRVRRPDGDQNLARLTVEAPKGVLASLRGIPYCPQAALNQISLPSYGGLAELASPSCPAASQVGTVVSGAGAGTHPVYNDGRVYLAGPYHGAPLSLMVVIPAVSGPYDLGNVAVRVALRVDPDTTKITAVSDPLPQIMEGIPLRTRSIQLSLDRPHFTLNPTDCAPAAVRASIVGAEGAAVSLGAHYQASNCTALGFKPKLALRLKGKKKRRGNPALHAVLTTGSDEANIGRTVVALPSSELLDNGHIKTICTRVQFAANACPAGSVYGTAEATTPLLDQPLRGPVYLRSSNHQLPDLVAAMHGQIDVNLIGRIDSIHGGLRTTFASVPDAPVSKFVLDMAGGSKGLLENSENLCRSKHTRAAVKMTGQNGARLNRRVKLLTGCGGSGGRR
jgi:hypothetical protein